ncbi:MAG: phosphoadenosine phosphosulfate reductase family protein [Planctomycetes bacterium]|nr:phosphoadenosine phosphosulfate reductase family protein [Planctomycetota bacterium]
MTTPRKTPLQTFTIHDFDHVIISSSGGKDSQAMLWELYKEAYDSGYPIDQITVFHAHLPAVEWPGVRELARTQAETLGLAYVELRRRQGGLLDHVRDRKMWPSPRQRYCTSDHKRAPEHRLYTRIARRWRERTGEQRPCRILSCMGMRAQESVSRAKMVPFQLLERASNGRRDVYQWLPLHDWTVDQVWEAIDESGLPHHWAYDIGMPRLSCCFCIFAPKSALVLAGRHNKELLEEYVRVEEEIGHTFKPDLTLREVLDEVESGETPETVPDWNM